MNQFSLTSPGSVQHVDGWSVRNIGRWAVGYSDAGNSGEMEIERGFDSDTIYPDTFRWISPVEREATELERELAVLRVTSGLQFISSKQVIRSPGQA
jgi:hypothetical protein